MKGILCFLLLIFLLFACLEESGQTQKVVEKALEQVEEQSSSPGIGLFFLKEQTFEFWKKNENGTFHSSLHFQTKDLSLLPVGRYKLIEDNKEWLLRPIEQDYPFDSLMELSLYQIIGEGRSLTQNLEQNISDAVDQIWVLPFKPDGNSLASGSFAASPKHVAQIVFLEQALHQLNSKQ